MYQAICAGAEGRSSSHRLGVIVTTHFVSHWHHTNAYDPVTFFFELDDERYEMRRVEVFADGRRLRSDRIDPDAECSLSWEPMPMLAEIQAQEEFSAEVIDAAHFEHAWDEAGSST